MRFVDHKNMFVRQRLPIFFQMVLKDQIKMHFFAHQKKFGPPKADEFFPQDIYQYIILFLPSPSSNPLKLPCCYFLRRRVELCSGGFLGAFADQLHMGELTHIWVQVNSTMGGDCRKPPGESGVNSTGRSWRIYWYRWTPQEGGV